MRFYLSVAIGGALGSVARAWLAILVAKATGPAFPWGTIIINIAGSFVIGLFGTLTADLRFGVPGDLRAFVMIGICGGFTTFSTFSIETVRMLNGGDARRAATYVAASLLLSVSAAALGVVAARAFARGA